MSAIPEIMKKLVFLEFNIEIIITGMIFCHVMMINRDRWEIFIFLIRDKYQEWRGHPPIFMSIAKIIRISIDSISWNREIKITAEEKIWTHRYRNVGEFFFISIFMFFEIKKHIAKLLISSDIHIITQLVLQIAIIVDTTKIIQILLFLWRWKSHVLLNYGSKLLMLKKNRLLKWIAQLSQKVVLLGLLRFMLKLLL